MSKVTKNILGLLVIVGLTWAGFLWLVVTQYIDTTSALVMAWISAILIVLGAKPEILESIKKVKVKDFEIELQDAIKKTSEEKLLSIKKTNGGELNFEKANWESLWNILSIARNNPEKDVLLHVNLERRINAPTLFIYLTLLDLVSKSTAVVFKTQSRTQKTSILGVISGKKVLRQLANIFPSLLEIYREPNFHQIVTQGWNENLRSLFVNQPPGISLFRNQNEFLITKEETLFWFGSTLNTTQIDLEITSKDVENIRNAFAKNDDYLIVYKGDEFHSVVTLCKLGKDISQKALENI